ncbi:MAG: Lrp/AsnC ligand binding domain-containing protein [Rhizobiaceae bacterium]|nr:Lrp/AsnC ligand binding domain-containing protein [Rhizobiaceae bacterium]
MKILGLDQFDIKLLEAIGDDARISVTELSAKIGLSKTPCHARLRRLEAEGYILGYRTLIDPVKLGLEHIAFVEVKLADTKASALTEFNEAVLKHPSIEQCHMIAGGFDYLLKVRTRNMSEYRALLGETISQLPHVAQTSTYVSMEAVKENALLSDIER